VHSHDDCNAVWSEVERLPRKRQRVFEGSRGFASEMRGKPIYQIMIQLGCKTAASVDVACLYRCWSGRKRTVNLVRHRCVGLLNRNMRGLSQTLCNDGI
jgi:tartrate dehydratase alpha subunit/fumarate hydratase class I-like protein